MGPFIVQRSADTRSSPGSAASVGESPGGLLRAARQHVEGYKAAASCPTTGKQEMDQRSAATRSVLVQVGQKLQGERTEGYVELWQNFKIAAAIWERREQLERARAHVVRFKTLVFSGEVSESAVAAVKKEMQGLAKTFAGQPKECEPVVNDFREALLEIQRQRKAKSEDAQTPAVQ